MMIIGTAFGRGVIAFLMIGDVGTLWLFPEAFALLVLQKSYSVAKSAVVPELFAPIKICVGQQSDWRSSAQCRASSVWLSPVSSH